MFNFQDMGKVILIIILVIVVQLSTLPIHKIAGARMDPPVTGFRVGYFFPISPKSPL